MEQYQTKRSHVKNRSSPDKLAEPKSPVMSPAEVRLAKVYDYNIHRNYNVFNDFQADETSLKTYDVFENKSGDKISEIKTLTNVKPNGQMTDRHPDRKT